MTIPPANPSGTILHLQRLSTEDGPGIRTTVFFKGCPLRCAWCHNPESLDIHPQVQWLENRCIGCGSCLEACPQQALRWEEGNGGAIRRGAGQRGEVQRGVLLRDRDACNTCGTCVEACPANAQERLGQAVDADCLVQELCKDRAFYASGGGVTLSGGEPTFQAAFCSAVTRRLKAAGISTALDTCGMCSWSTLEQLLPEVDIVLFDVKSIDPTLHEQWTGQPNRVILENLQLLVCAIQERHPQVVLWVRTPLIPSVQGSHGLTPPALPGTASRENVQAIADFLGHTLAAHGKSMVQRWELCGFNNLCRDKYRRLGVPWAYAAAPLLSQGELNQAGEWARASLGGAGLDPALVVVSGAARNEPLVRGPLVRGR